MPLEEFPGSPGMQTRRFGGFCYFRVSVSRPRANGAVRAADTALRERAAEFAAHQCAVRDHEQAEQTKLLIWTLAAVLVLVVAVLSSLFGA